MGREIKFRAWNRLESKMHSFEDIKHRSGSNLSFGFWDLLIRPDLLIPMQYTGLKDKNGKEIYEGDIVNVKWATANTGKYFQSDDMWNDHEETVTVEFRNMGFCFIGKNGQQFSKRKDASIETIGNIYENPELL